MSHDIGARIMVGERASLDLIQTFAGSRGGDIYLKCHNLRANVDPNCGHIVLRAVACGSFYPEVLWVTWLQLLYALNNKPAPNLKRLTDMKHNRLALEPLPLDTVVRQHDDDAQINFLNLKCEDHGYRLWMDDLWDIPYLPESGVLLKPEHMNTRAWRLLEKIASLLHHPDLRARSDEMAKRAKSLNHITDKAVEMMRQYVEKKNQR